MKRLLSKELFKQYLLYIIRWQLSTPILALCLIWLASLNEITATIIANFIGAILMYPVDKFIFSSDRKKNQQDK